MADLPTGVVVLLMTDIAGSTRLWQADPALMSRALKRHDALMGEAVARHGGALVKAHAAGDSVLAVFTEAAAAIAAAVDIQDTLQRERWPTSAPIRLRMALHAGDAELRDGDYFGPTVNRCARLRGIAHPGQILISRAVQSLAGDRMPAEVRTRPLGKHWLRDLQQPEDIYQLLHPGLPADFPPLASPGAIPNNLPIQLTSFIGRDDDLETLPSRVVGNRLVTLVGVGGSGKTRLGIETATAVLPDFADGVWWVDLVPLEHPEQVLKEVAHVLGVREGPNEALFAALVTAIGADHKLVILDNCEHLLQASAALASELLHACPNLHILATSREPLNVRGEVTYTLRPLTYPDPCEPLPFPTLAGTEAVRLFADRATVIRRTFALTAGNATAVAGICARLEGNPLAIELAAAWVNVLTVEQILARLGASFDLLRTDTLDVPERHQSLRAVVDWSYALLAPPLKRCFSAAAVFTGGWSLAAAEHVLAPAEGDVLSSLSALVDKSLVVMDQGSGPEARFRLLETLRTYAWRYLEESGTVGFVRQRHAEFFLALAEMAEAKLTGSEQAEWLAQIQGESGNLLGALGWLRASGDAARGLRLAGSLWRWWYMQGQLSEGRAQLAAVLALPGEEGTAIRAKALHAAGTLASLQGDYAEARPLLESALAIRKALGDEVGQCQTLTNLGNLAYEQDDYATARRCYEDSLRIFRAAGSAWNTALAQFNLASVAYAQCDLVTAEHQVSESLALSRRHAFDRPIVNSLVLLGIIAWERGQFDTARRNYEEAFAKLDALDDAPGLAEAHRLLGSVLYEQGHVDEALVHMETSLKLETQIGDRLGVAKASDWIGRIALGRSDIATARARFRQSLDIATAIGHKLIASDALETLGRIAFQQGHVGDGAVMLAQSFELRQSLQNPLRVAESIEVFAVFAVYVDRHSDACRLAGYANATREALGTPLPPSRAIWLIPAMQTARDHLGDAEARAAWEDGARLSQHDAANLVLSITADHVGTRRS